MNCLKRIETLLTLVQHSFIAENYLMNQIVTQSQFSILWIYALWLYLSSQKQSFPLPTVTTWETSPEEKVSKKKREKNNRRHAPYSSVKNIKANFTAHLIQCHLLKPVLGCIPRHTEAMGVNWVIDKLFLHLGWQLNENPCMAKLHLLFWETICLKQLLTICPCGVGLSALIVYLTYL